MPSGASGRSSATTAHLRAVLTEMDALQRRGETDVESALRTLNEASVESVPGSKYAGITVIDEHGAVVSLGVTDGAAAVLDDVQRDVREGPCLSAAWSQHTIVIHDMAAEQRWPRYRDEALDRTSVRSVLSFRLHEEGSGIAALNFYADTAGVFDEESVEVGLIVAAHTTLAWNTLRREQQFRSALASRDVIGQAKGMLMERFDIDAVSAFELIRKLSQDSNTKLSDIARRLIAREHVE